MTMLKIIAAEESRLLDRLDSISKYFEIQCANLFKQYDINNDLAKVSEEKIHITQSSSPSPFDIIYQAAKLKDSAAIKGILKEVTLDVEVMLDGAPVSKHASDGNVHAVDYLLKEFNASSRWAVYGYGRSVNVVEAQRLLARA
jgi:hypothetical protein